MELHVGKFGPARIFGRTLVVLCAYRGARQGGSTRFVATRIRGLRRALNWITLLSLRGHIATLRDHYANPRTLATQAQLASAALALGQPTTVRFVVDALMADVAQGMVALHNEPLETVALDRDVVKIVDIDTVILVYPDALGLGFSRLESRLASAGAHNIAVVTGRRRLFPLTSVVRRTLRWRRFLASTRLPELAASVAVVPLALVLAGYDRVRGRT